MNEATTFEKAAKAVTDGLLARTYAFCTTTLAEFDGFLDSETPAQWRAPSGHLFRIGAVVGLRGLQGQAPFSNMVELADLAYRTVCSKQADYGHANIDRFGIEGIKVRLSDKICRINNLAARDPQNESLFDSWLDIVGYCVIGLMVTEGTFGLPLAADLPSPNDLASALGREVAQRRRDDESDGAGTEPLGRRIARDYFEQYVDTSVPAWSATPMYDYREARDKAAADAARPYDDSDYYASPETVAAFEPSMLILERRGAVTYRWSYAIEDWVCDGANYDGEF